MAQYGIVDYWNKRYTEADHVTLKIIKEYDWYVDAEDAKNLVISYLAGKLEAKILIIGCGISLLTRELYKEGFKNLTAIDFCEEAISIMRERDKDLEGLQILVMDVRNLSMFPDHAFDCIVDKACIDAVMSSNSSIEAAHKALEETSRVLAPEGIFLSFSYADIQSRYPHLKKDQFEWTVGQTSMSTGIDNDISYSVFIATKWNAKQKAEWQIEEDKRLELLQIKLEKQKAEERRLPGEDTDDEDDIKKLENVKKEKQ